MSRAETVHEPVGAGAAAVRALAFGLVGLVVGALLGIVVDLVIWIWAFGQTLASNVPRDIPWFVDSAVESDGVSATLGLGMLMLPVVLVMICGGLGALFGWRRRTVPSRS